MRMFGKRNKDEKKNVSVRNWTTLIEGKKRESKIKLL